MRFIQIFSAQQNHSIFLYTKMLLSRRKVCFNSIFYRKIHTLTTFGILHTSAFQLQQCLKDQPISRQFYICLNSID